MDNLHIDAGILRDGDLAMWDDAADKILRSEDITTPTTIEPFFDRNAAGTPSPVYNQQGAQCAWAAAAAAAAAAQHAQQVEPSNEPCTDEIPWTDLVYWLGNSSTGQVECSCPHCQQDRSQGRVPGVIGPDGIPYVPSSVYKRLAAKIPVIAVPRIEGVN